MAVGFGWLGRAVGFVSIGVAVVLGAVGLVGPGVAVGTLVLEGEVAVAGPVLVGCVPVFVGFVDGPSPPVPPAPPLGVSSGSELHAARAGPETASAPIPFRACRRFTGWLKCAWIRDVGCFGVRVMLGLSSSENSEEGSRAGF